MCGQMKGSFVIELYILNQRIFTEGFSVRSKKRSNLWMPSQVSEVDEADFLQPISNIIPLI